MTRNLLTVIPERNDLLTVREVLAVLIVITIAHVGCLRAFNIAFSHGAFLNTNPEIEQSHNLTVVAGLDRFNHG